MRLPWGSHERTLQAAAGDGSLKTMKRHTTTYVVGGAGLATALILGCAAEPRIDEGTWYEHSRDHSRRRQAYVESQTDAGVTELDAKQSWERGQMIGNTLGSWTEMSLQGDELHDIIESP